ncbi:MAG: ATP-binding protein [Mycetocola sp.]
MNDTVSRWWGSVSLRSKITGVTVLVLTFGLLLAGVGTVTMLKPILESQVEEALINTAQGDTTHLVQVTKDGNDVLSYNIQERDEFVALYDLQGGLLGTNWAEAPSGLKPDVPDTLTDESLTTFGGYPHELASVNGNLDYRAYVVQITSQPSGEPYGYALFATSMRPTETIIAMYLTIFFGLGTGVIVVGALITRLLVTSTFRPLRDVEDTAAAFAEGDFNQRLPPVSTPNTEVGRLNRSLNMMLSRIDSAFADRARTIDQMRRFVGDASHELRTPLVTVRGYAELYRMGALATDTDIAQAMERIEKEAIRMGLLVEDLLELARLDETKPLAIASVNLSDIARDAAMDARAASPGRSITVVLDEPIAPARTVERTAAPAVSTPRTDPGSSSGPATPPATGAIAFAGATLARLRNLRPRRTAPDSATSLSPIQPEAETRPQTPAIVLGEENKLRQVVTNLMGNALRFSPDNSPIEIGVSADPVTGRATIAVIDHGEGIPPQIREKVFQRFWRADTSRARDTGGSGLGLAIVASIVAAHQGTVAAVETPGGGATFRVDLPLSTASTDPTGSSPAPTEITPGQNTDG